MLQNFAIVKNRATFASPNQRGVAQPGLEYASGGRVVASSNLVTPTGENEGVKRLA